ncbi:hypothetical protein DICPUDRAFT_99401 [Dictyostelium purpureum]|uniref:Protein kinase domain-containing protein n=1 Tax=Dictyostelium purpureum TaxID=5786 RepID=F0ZYX7_DICPU|nr:uncharacterized protein DICPUDRAFT_99401 [Dictyostelium purpureum]EGC30852.1 hypothetical protein DICPUDRAFT_99401 [Dictyostelium purpureum]|eukprot:XP_003292618.1 hypothetical protein DICPUDRAFT_99401 [Dictyostelium purpureum]
MTLIKCIQSFGNITYNSNGRNSSTSKSDICTDSSAKGNEDKNKSCYVITDSQTPHCSIPANDCISCGTGFTPNHNFHIINNNKQKLINCLKNYSKKSFYLTIKEKIIKYLEIIKKDKAFYYKLKEINEIILEPKLLFSTDQNDRVSFFDDPAESHELFEPYKFRIQKFIDFKEDLDKNKHVYLINLFEQLIKGYKEEMQCFIQNAIINKLSKKRMNMYNNDVYLVSEDLEFKEISLNIAYELSCYHQTELDYVRTNPTGNSIGKKIGECYVKVDSGDTLLAPANEDAVYKLCCSLFGTDQEIVMPTGLLILSKVPILPANLRDSPQRKKMAEIKKDQGYQSNKEVFIFDPQLKQEVKDAMKEVRTLSIQASLYKNGPTLFKFLEGIQNSPDYETKLLSTIDLYNYSCHIFSSLLLLHEDYKADNLIVDLETGKIVGIDNDHCLENDEMKKEKNSNGYLITIRNILYLLEPLMNKPVNKKARDQFISKQPHHLILDWLLHLFKQENMYTQLIEMSLFTNGLEFPNEQTIEQTCQSLRLPIKFQKGFIDSLLKRFIKIKNLLTNNPNITHQQLFKEIHPFASVYYEAVKKCYNTPLTQIASMYPHCFDEKVQQYLKDNSIVYKDFFSNLSKHQFIQSERSISILDSIYDFIYNIDVCLDLLESLNETAFSAIVKIITYLYKDFSIELQLNNSWVLYIQKTLKILMTQNETEKTIKALISILRIKNLDQNVLGEESSIINIVLTLPISFENKIKYIKLLASFGSSLNIVERSNSCLDLAVTCSQNKNDSINLFRTLIELGAGKFCKDQIILDFYGSLTREDKLDLMETIETLLKVNRKIVWLLSLNHLFPLLLSGSYVDPNRILRTTTKGDRIINNDQWDQIFDSNNIPIKKNEYGTRSVPFIEDCGHRIYLKLEPQFPGSELAVFTLGQRLFGYCSPFSELSFVNGMVVLLSQEIKGDVLIDFIKKDSKKLSLINPKSISRLLVLEILINNGDGNLANYIVPNSDEEIGSYDIYSIDNELAFMPPFAQEIKKGRIFPNIYLSLQVQTSLLLFEQMFNFINQDVVKELLKKDLIFELKEWVKDLLVYHDKWTIFFSNKYIIENRKNSDSSIIGIHFVPGQLKNLYSKLVRLQKLIAKPITHFKLLESLEPMVAKRYKEIFKQSPECYSVYIRSQILKNSKEESCLTSSSFLTEHVLESRDVPNAERIRQELKNGRYGPEQALYEIVEIEGQFSSFNEIYEILQKFDGNPKQQKNNPYIGYISDAKLELALKESNLEKLTSLQEQHLFKLLEGKQLLKIILRSSKELSNKYLNALSFNNVTILNFSNSQNLESISKGKIIKSQIEMPLLKKLKLNNCPKLTELMIVSNSLTHIFAINCRFKIFRVDSQELNTIFLSNESIQSIDILSHLSTFKKLIFLDLSKNQLLNNINLEAYNICSKKIIIDNRKILIKSQLSASLPFYYSSSSSTTKLNNSSLSSSSSSISASSSPQSPLSSSLSSFSSLSSLSSSNSSEEIESINILSCGSYLKNACLIGKILCNKELINNRKPIGTSGGGITIDDKFFLYCFIDENQIKTTEFEINAKAIILFFDPSLDEEKDIDQIKSSVSLLKKYYKLSMNVYGLSIPYVLFGASKDNKNKVIPKLIQNFYKMNPNIKLIYNIGVNSKEKELILRKELYDYLDHYL